jgi:hypothetical protein
MANGDPFLHEVSRRAILSGATFDQATLLYRQVILRDGLTRLDILREIYALVIEANDIGRKAGGGIGFSTPSGVLGRSITAMNSYVKAWQRLGPRCLA